MASVLPKYFALSLLLILLEFTMAHSLQDPLKLTEPITITPYSRRNTLFGETGIIPGYRNCGGSAKIIKFRNEQCVTGSNAPCILRSSTSRRAEFVFVPAEDMDGVGVRMTIIKLPDLLSKSYEVVMDDVKLVAGEEYVLQGATAVAPELIGKLYIFQGELFRKDDKRTEACVQAALYTI